MTDQYSKGLENGGLTRFSLNLSVPSNGSKIDSSPPAYCSAAADALEPLKPLNISSYLACPCSAENRSGYTRFTQIYLASGCISRISIASAVTIERLYRLRYLRRGTHTPRSGAELVLTLWVNLFRPCPADTS